MAVTTMIPVKFVKYSVRFPVHRSNVRKQKIPKLLTTLAIAFARSGAIGLSYAVKISTLYGIIAITPANSAITNAAITMQNGFFVCDRPSSRNRWHIVGIGCGHFWFILIQLLHDFERSVYRCSSWSSLATADFGAHPRNHCKAFSASAVRFFASSQIGVSGS